MKKITNLLFILLVIFFFNLKSQTVKTFSGIYEDGVATYNYYENENYERIYHGPFSFKSDDKRKTIFTIKGQFKDNLKNGAWVFKKIEYDKTYKKSKSNMFEEIEIIDTIVYTQKGSYLSGRRNGTWTYKITSNNITTFNSTVSFKNDSLIGSFYYKRFDKVYFSIRENAIESIEITGQLNSNSYLDGDWKINRFATGIGKREDIRKYKDGFMYYRLYRDVSTGDIIHKLDYSTYVDSLLNGYVVFIKDEGYAFLNERVPITNPDYDISKAFFHWQRQSGYFDYKSLLDNDLMRGSYFDLDELGHYRLLGLLSDDQIEECKKLGIIK